MSYAFVGSAGFVGGGGSTPSGASQPPPKFSLTPTILVKNSQNTLLTPSGFTTNRVLGEGCNSYATVKRTTVKRGILRAYNSRRCKVQNIARPKSFCFAFR